MTRKLRILNLEDVEADAELVQHVLTREGFEFSIVRVDTREDFLKAVVDFRPDMILSDYALPSFDGLSALQIALDIIPDIPFIFISGTLGEENAIETLKMGATDYVLKDRLTRLGQVVRRALQESRERSERKTTQEALRKSEEQYRQIVETAQEGIWTIDAHGTTIFVNRRMAEMLGYTVEEMMGASICQFMDESTQTAVSEHCELGEQEFSLRHKDGSQRWVRMTTSPLYDDKGSNIGMLAMLNDITARKEAEDERNKLWAAVETGGDWVLVTDIHGNIEYVNRAVEQISGYSREEMLGKNPRIFKSEKQDDSVYQQMWDVPMSGEAFRSIVINRKKDGALFYLDLTITPLMDEKGHVINFVTTGKDISEKRLMEERLNYLAYSDVLTGLANRSLFFDRLQQAVSTATLGKKLVVAAIINLKRFKYINETLGVAAGDEVLQEVGKRLTASVRPGDTVARYGGNTFGLVLVEMAEMKDLILFVERILMILSSPYHCGNEEVIAMFSMGISVCPTDSSEPQKLMQHAEAALFSAKEQKGNSYRFYTPGMNILAADFLTMEKNMYHALAANDFVLHYQPYFEVKTGVLKGMEALIRWQKNGRDLILPGEFIPILEETGLIVDVGEWVIKTACNQIAQWRDQGLPLVPVSVNLSPTQFRQENLVERIKSHISVSGVAAKQLTIEITENIFISNLEYTRDILKQFQELGLRLSIDDFGTGYSSLSYLARLPLNNLKIDISFIRNIANDPKAYSIVKVIISMAHELGLETIAEGVDSIEQLMLLEQLGCDFVQGFYYRESLPEREMIKVLEAGRVVLEKTKG